MYTNLSLEKLIGRPRGLKMPTLDKRDLEKFLADEIAGLAHTRTQLLLMVTSQHVELVIACRLALECTQRVMLTCVFMASTRIQASSAS